MFLIVGLGNPEKKYAHTRHNAGFLAVSALRGDALSPWKLIASLAGEVREGEFEGERVVLIKPHTYMNLSGKSVAAAMKKYRITADRLIVVHDDMDFPLGTVKIQQGRSAAGHNGVQSIIDTLGTKNFMRVRVGVGPRTSGVPGHTFVLERFTAAEEKTLRHDTIPHVAAGIGTAVKMKAL